MSNSLVGLLHRARNASTIRNPSGIKHGRQSLRRRYLLLFKGLINYLTDDTLKISSEGVDSPYVRTYNNLKFGL